VDASPDFDPTVQTEPDGQFTATFVDELKAERTRLTVPLWRIAKAAKISASFLANAIRYPAAINTVKISTTKANRVAAVVKALKRARSEEEAAIALNPAVEAPVLVEAPKEAPHDSLEHALAILRRRGIAVTMSLR
jgi:hypothetical protein